MMLRDVIYIIPLAPLLIQLILGKPVRIPGVGTIRMEVDRGVCNYAGEAPRPALKYREKKLDASYAGQCTEKRCNVPEDAWSMLIPSASFCAGPLKVYWIDAELGEILMENSGSYTWGEHRGIMKVNKEEFCYLSEEAGVSCREPEIARWLAENKIE